MCECLFTSVESSNVIGYNNEASSVLLLSDDIHFVLGLTFSLQTCVC